VGTRNVAKNFNQIFVHLILEL